MAELSDDELLARVALERRGAVGFDTDAELSAQREQALNYYQGRMPDMPADRTRSAATSSDVADAIETVLPDLIEIFTGGDDVLAFTARGAEDEAAAEQETDFVRHVFFNENNGFLILHDQIKDALLSKIGVVRWGWDAFAGAQEQRFRGKTLADAAVAQAGGAEILDLQLEPPDGAEGDEEGAEGDAALDPAGAAVWSFTARRGGGRLVVECVPPEDFAAARDATLDIAEATYCAVRSRPRAQALVAQGIDADLVARLPAWSTYSDGVEALARDTVGEGAKGPGAADDDLRQVEVVEHYIRLAGADGRLELWRVLTGAGETVLLHRERASRIPYAVITPYIMPHRLYGASVADKLVELQKIRTALIRMLLDSGYFALNQRHQVADRGANEFTLSDLMRNEPMAPVRVKEIGAVSPLGGAGVSFDIPGALEFFATIGEQRTGIVRNAQGLNPDTLHDTARGALALMGAAQKRVRLIARIFAETGLKALFTGLHATLRENATQGATVRLRGVWKEVDPTSWGERADMTVQVGLGSAGREHDIAAIRQAAPLIQEIVSGQGGFAGPIVTPRNIYAMTRRALEKLGFKDAEQYLTDPDAPPAPGGVGAAGAGAGGAAGAGPPRPDPAALKAAAEAQLAREKLAAELEAARAKAAADLTLGRERLAMEFQLKREQAAAEIALKGRELAAEAALKGDLAAAGAAPKSASLGDVQVGGQPG